MTGIKIDGTQNKVVLDDDADTYFEAATDDTIKVYVAGAQDFTITANTLTAESGSTIAAQALTATSITATGDISLDGGSFVFNESSADKDFRVESNGNDHMLFVDGGNDCVNIGASSDRGGLLNVEGNGGVVIRVADNNDALKLQSTDTDANAGPLLTLERSNNSAANADETGKIVFKAQNNANEATVYSRIVSQINDVTDGAEDGIISLQTIISGTVREGMRFSDGGVVFNELSQDIDLRVEGNGDTHLLHCDAGGDHVNIKTGSSDLSTSLGVGGSGERALFIYQALNQDTVVATWKNVYANGSNTATMIQFTNSGNTEVGSIKSSGSATAYNTSSDYRLKENVDYDWDATTRLKQLKPARFNWIADETNTLEDGFLAHEVSSIVPEAISGIKDAATTLTKAVIGEHGNVIAQNIEESAWTAGKADGTYDANTTWHASKVNPIYQQIDLGKLVPLLVKTVQEQEARIKALEDA